MLGTRGIPASYSGFETCVEQLGQRLVERGHQVTVYCRSHHISYPNPEYKGMKLVKLPTIKNKYLDTLCHTLLSSLHCLPGRYEVALYFIAGNSPVTWIPRLFGVKTVLNVDGLDWKREKWPAFAKIYIQLAEYLATLLPTRFLTDSKIVQEYYSQRFKRRPLYIPYGSEVELVGPGETLAKYGLERQKYILFVGRLVPENGAHHLIEAFRELQTNLKCVVVGDAPYAGDYQLRLKNLAQNDPRIIFTGYLFGKGYMELGSNALIFAGTSGVGGTHPAFLEAMAFGNCLVVNNTPENLETIGKAGLFYEGQRGAASLKEVLAELLQNPELVEEYRRKARKRAETNFSWEAVTDSYEQLFKALLKGP